MVLINKWSLGITFFNLINEGLLKCCIYLQGGLYLEVVFNTALITLLEYTCFAERNIYILCVTLLGPKTEKNLLELALILITLYFNNFYTLHF